MTYAKVIADSFGPGGVRLTTMEVCFHRFVLAEFNTHRVFSRNSASSRAIPLRKQLERVRSGAAFPVSFPAEQRGMQGGEELTAEALYHAKREWRDAATAACVSAMELGRWGVHKSIANRLLEPFMWHTVVVTSTAWENFFKQRCSPLAQPEIRAAAELMQEAYVDSVPHSLKEGEWHLPYVKSEDYVPIVEPGWRENRAQLPKISAARCARVSYLTQDGVRDQSKDLELYERLVTAKPAHWSPLEHVATPWLANRQTGIKLTHRSADGEWQIDTPLDHLPHVGNLLEWRTLRFEVETQQGEVTFS